MPVPGIARQIKIQLARVTRADTDKPRRPARAHGLAAYDPKLSGGLPRSIEEGWEDDELLASESDLFGRGARGTGGRWAKRVMILLVAALAVFGLVNAFGSTSSDGSTSSTASLSGRFSKSNLDPTNVIPASGSGSGVAADSLPPSGNQEQQQAQQQQQKQEPNTKGGADNSTTPTDTMTAASAALAAWTAQTPEERKATGFPLPPIVHTKWNDRTSIPHRAQECVDGWQIKNPSATVLVWTDADTNAFVQLHFPAWWPVYSRLPRNVMKVDIVRNMLLAVYGGVWADIDACPLRPLSDWGLGASDKLVVGTEADMESSVWPTHFARKFQFCTWTFASVPGHPVMAEFLHRTGAKLDERRNTSGAYSPPITDGDVLDFTGPGMFTDAVFSYLGQHGDTSFDAMHFMPSRMHFGDATVLPLWQFSPGSTQTGTSRPTYSRNHLDPEALVLHLFLGSWRDGKY